MAKLSSDGSYVIVEKGDTLSEIAQDYGNGKTYQQLAAMNDIDNPDLIYIGQKILLTTTAKKETSSAICAKIKHFGEQADVENTLLATWTWTRSQTENYQVQWGYYTADKVWFTGNDSTTNYTYSTYSIPANAKKVRFRVKPISKKRKSGDKETPYWTASWTGYKTHSVVIAPAIPPVPTVTLKDFKLTAEVNNLTGDPSIIQFEIVKDDSATYKTGKASVNTSTASYSCTVVAGSKYKVRCRAYKDGVYGDWSNYSSNVDTVPSTPSGFTKCEPKSLSDPASIYLEWSSITNATSYDIEYATSKAYFDGSDQVTSKTGITTNSYEISSGIETGKEYFFRVRAVNANGNSGWSEVSSTIIGTGPAAPTTWSSTTTVVVGEPLTLYWVHNSEDGSSQTYAELELYIDGVKESHTIENSTAADEKDKTSTYTVDTTGHAEGAKISWRVRTAGISKVYGDWSILRVVDIYAPPTLALTLTNSSGNAFDTLTSFPFTVIALAGPNTQRPIGYFLSITSNEIYETVDNLGNDKTVKSGEQVYSKHFDINDDLEVVLSAGDVSLENNVTYTITCTVSMDSGLMAEATSDFYVDWVVLDHVPSAEVSVDEDTYSAYIRPYCGSYSADYHKVNRLGNVCTITSETLEGVYGTPISDLFTTTGEQVYYGTTSTGEETYYCIVETLTTIPDVLLSVYRREFDGSFTELATGLDSAKNTTITDPHPSLDYARYRIVAMSKTTGAVNYNDIPGYVVGGKAAIIQWDEDWTTFDTYGEDNELEQPPWSGSLLKLPYNIDVSDKRSLDVSFIEYIGRDHPVSYYGTQVGETQTWSMVIEKSDKETLYALRRLSVWKGNAYVREPSGSGYWASVSVSFNQKHREVTIPVTIEITRVEGGM